MKTVKALFFLWVFTMPFVGKLVIEAVDGSVELGTFVALAWLIGTAIFGGFIFRDILE